MTPEELKSVIEKTIGQQFDNYWIYLLLSILIALITTYLVQYLKEKAKNLATKEDVADITSKVEEVKQSYKIKFDEIQQKNDLIFSELKESKSRYNSKQFELYNELWSSLIDLKLSADELWNSATVENLKRFSSNLHNAKTSIEKSSLLIEDEHYNELMKITVLEEYQVGKTELIKFRNKTVHEARGLAEQTYIDRLIQNNSVLKQNYDILMKQLKKQFQNTIRGETL